MLRFLTFFVRILLRECKPADHIPLAAVLQCIDSMLN